MGVGCPEALSWWPLSDSGPALTVTEIEREEREWEAIKSILTRGLDEEPRCQERINGGAGALDRHAVLDAREQRSRLVRGDG